MDTLVDWEVVGFGVFVVGKLSLDPKVSIIVFAWLNKELRHTKPW